MQRVQQNLVKDSTIVSPLLYILNFFSFGRLAYENVEMSHSRSVTTQEKQKTKLSTKHKDKVV